ncbi:MAG: hypothetical protein F6K03_15715, partial [Kamptonema sp. SIO4C4]|nr:hypothetical protein [Kamptonema sp. SIO4C4]
VLHRQVLLARWWVVLSALCWGMSLAVGWFVGGILRGLTHLFLGDVIGLGMTWVLVGGVTGWGLTIFLQRHS